MEADIKKIVAARLEIENTQRGIEEPAVNGEYFREAEVWQLSTTMPN